MLSADGNVDGLVQSVGGDADVSSSSADGDVTIPHVAGHFSQNNTGAGDFKINGGKFSARRRTHLML